MWVLIFDDGIVAASWYAEFAFRNRVSMSAIGSVIVMASGASLAAVPRALGLGDLAQGLSAIGGARWVRCWSGTSLVWPGCRAPRRAERVAGGSRVLHQLDFRTP